MNMKIKKTEEVYRKTYQDNGNVLVEIFNLSNYPELSFLPRVPRGWKMGDDL